MRMLLLGVLSAAVTFPIPAVPITLVAQAVRPAAAARLTGRVVAGTGNEARPVRRARVTLTGAALAPPRVADTDAKGVYTFTSLPAGAFKIKVEKPGFVTLDADAAPDATLTMTRGGAIEGIVSDAAGDPVWNVAVTALQPQPDGKPRVIAQTHSDDLGRYRIHSLPAGDYLVSASTDRATLLPMFLMPGEKRPDPNASYYPSALAIEDAKPVRVSAGRDSTAVDISFTPAPPLKDPAAPPQPPRPDATGTGRIAGLVTDATSGKPIPYAELLLLPAPGQGPRLTNWTRTDRQGRFEYTSLVAQRYTLEFRAKRYVTLGYGQRRPGDNPSQITLADGADFRADMKLARASAIEGNLLDEFGEPAPSVLVQYAQKGYIAGRQRLLPGPSSAATPPSDDRGHFRIASVAPGDYYVAALSGAFTEANEVGGFAPTYYPGTADAGGATPVTVAFGADTSAVTFALVPARTYSVAGTMIGPDGKPVAGRATLWLAPPDRLKRMDFNLARGTTEPDGTFLLRNVPQGSYTLQGFAPPPPGYRGPGNLSAFPFGWMPVVVGDSNLDGIVLKTSEGTALRGRIVVEDGVTPPKADLIRVDTVPIEWDSAPVAGGPSPSKTNDDYTFEVLRQNGIRRILPGVQSPDWMLKKITFNGQDVTDAGVDFRTKDVEGVEITLTSKVTHVTGGVSDDKGPVSDYVVVIFASDPTKWIDRSRFVGLVRPAQQGRFRANGLPPEDYLAIALPSVNGPEFMDPDFLQQLRAQASSFTLGEGETKTLELKLKRRP